MSDYEITNNKPHNYTSKINAEEIWYVLYLGAVIASTNSKDIAERMVKFFEDNALVANAENSKIFSGDGKAVETNSDIAFIFITANEKQLNPNTSNKNTPPGNTVTGSKNK
jgi:hypothetical protein